MELSRIPKLEWNVRTKSKGVSFLKTLIFIRICRQVMNFIETAILFQAVFFKNYLPEYLPTYVS